MSGEEEMMPIDEQITPDGKALLDSYTSQFRNDLLSVVGRQRGAEAPITATDIATALSHYRREAADATVFALRDPLLKVNRRSRGRAVFWVSGVGGVAMAISLVVIALQAVEAAPSREVDALLASVSALVAGGVGVLAASVAFLSIRRSRNARDAEVEELASIQIADFLSNWVQVEALIGRLFDEVQGEPSFNSRPFGLALRSLMREGVVEGQLLDDLTRLVKRRNDLVHGRDSHIEQTDIDQALKVLRELEEVSERLSAE